MLTLTFNMQLRKKRGKMATINDIAQKTGFSLMTVSRAFNNPEKVKSETRSKIFKVAEELDYHPNNIARSLVRKCTNIIFVYIPRELSATEQFVSQTVTAIGERLGQQGYSFLLSRKLPTDESYDGIIMIGLSEDDQKRIINSVKLTKPVVLYGNSSDFDSWVDVDNYSGEKIAVDYLVERGCKNIATIAALQFMHYGQERLMGYKDSLTNHKIAIDDRRIVVRDTNEGGGYDGTIALLNSGVEIDSIVCATDTMAIGCIRALKENGKRIPDDIAVMGFDGFGHENLVSPTLTTVKQPLFEVGVKLADAITGLISGNEPQRIKILPTLVKGESA